ncbi:MAG: non-canonical purine NTP pyrophosphatase [Chloroflexota bacterium]
MKSLLLGTRNPARVRMLRAALARLSLRVVTLDELGITSEVVEDRRSTRENAEKKARAYFERAGIPTLGLDGGLTTPAFPSEKQPGVCVRRIHAGGAPATDEEMLAYYAREISAGAAVDPHLHFRDLADLTAAGSGRPWHGPRPAHDRPALRQDYTQLADEERPYYRHLVDFVAEHIQEL